MYLWKYLRESRNILILAAILLTIMTVLVVKGEITMADHNITHFNTEDFRSSAGYSLLRSMRNPLCWPL